VRVPLSTILREWGRIGCIGFGGPPTHIALLRELYVRRGGGRRCRTRGAPLPH
jgi:chromate transporter